MGSKIRLIVNKFFLPTIFLVAFLLRIKLFAFKTHWSDMYFWKDWGEGIIKFGASQFYSHFNADYLPFYPLVLGLVYKLYNISQHLHHIPIHYFYKFPAAISDIFLSLILFKILKKKSYKLAIIITVLFLFNPAVFVNSSMWGQVDVIGTLFVVSSFYFFEKKYFYLVGACLGIAVSTKIIYILSLPVLLIGLFLQAKFEKNDFYWFIKNQLIMLFSLVLTVFLIFYPFVDFTDKSLINILTKPFVLLIERYQQISQRYPYTSVNAFNFWAIIDKDFWLSDLRKYSIFSYYQWGNLINLLICFLVLLRLFLVKKTNLFYKMNLSLALLFLSSFLFLTRIHERHLFYIFPFLLIAGYYNRRLLINYFILSATYVLNLQFGLEYLYQNKNYFFSWPVIKLFSFINLLMFLWLILEYFLLNKPLKKNEIKNLS